MSIYTEVIEIEAAELAEEVGRLLGEELKACLGPVAEALDCSLALETVGGRDALAAVAGCGCGDHFSLATTSWSCREDRSIAALPIAFEGVELGRLLICRPAGVDAVVRSSERIVRSTLQRLTLERQETLLLTELGSCWENLEALYDVHALLPDCRSVEAMIEWILERVVDGDDGLLAQFWLEVDGHIEPTSSRGRGEIDPELGLAGLVGRSISEQRPRVFAPVGMDLADGPGEDRWGGSSRLLIAPASTRHGTRGAMVILNQGARPFDSRVMRHARALAMQAVMAAEGDRLYRAALENELVQQEMEIGSKMQQLLLLGDKPNAIGFAEVASLAIQSQALGGDFLEFFHLSPSQLDILIGDVMGKGLRASLIGAAITRQFHRSLCSLMSIDSDAHAAPETIVSSVHEGVARRLAEFESFATLDYARVDALRGRLDFVDCGHPPILHYHHRTRRCEALRGRNIPLGFSDFETYEQVSVPFEDGDMFVFYSDGVTETRNPDGDLFGQDRLVALTESAGASGDPEILTKAVRRALAEFAEEDRVDDDLTLAVIKVKRLKRPEPIVMGKTIEIVSELDRLEDCRSFVRAICSERGQPVLDEDQLGMLELAVTEVASNIMIHAQGCDSRQKIRIEGEIFDDSVLVRFDYAGESFDPASAPEPTFDGTQENGYGVYLTSQCVDQVNYNCKGDGLNYIVMIKNRS